MTIWSAGGTDDKYSWVMGREITVIANGGSVHRRNSNVDIPPWVACISPLILKYPFKDAMHCVYERRLVRVMF